MSKPFKLSCTLQGHSLDVRSVSSSQDNFIVSGSRDKTAKFWKPNAFNNGYEEVMTYRDQKNFVASVLYLDPTPEFPDGLIITGGNDKAIIVYKPGEPFATFTFTEHSNTVCCLSKGLDVNTFLSSSWDTTAKMWNLTNIQSSLVTFSGHTAAVWSVIQMSNSNIATASADRTVGLWFKDGQRFLVVTGHSDCVRGLADFPECSYFASVSNDATIKLWNYAGENIDTLYGHTNYIYSIARHKASGDNCFVTSDEDRTVRYWADGVNTDTFQLPTQSVWSVCCLRNGDIVTGSSDGAVRVFSQDENRWASPDALKVFENEVLALQQQSSQEIGGYKVSDLPGREALFEEGKKPGQMKMIREPHGVVAYTWVDDGPNSHWEKVGDVLGGTDKATEGKTMFEGQAYDYVFSVDVEDGKPPLKLPYNKGDDVYKAANQFLTRNMLPAVYLDQVVDFILKNSDSEAPKLSAEYVDPFTGASRYTPGSSGTSSGFGQSGANVDPFTGQSSYSTSAGTSVSNPLPAPTPGTNADPFTGSSSYTSLNSKYFPLLEYRTFDMGDPDVILRKLKEFNQSGDNSSKIDESMLEEVVKLCKQPVADPKSFDTLFTILNWPDDIVFPAIDVVRLAVKSENSNKLISLKDNGAIVDKLKEFIGPKSKVQNNVVVSLRTLCNFFSHPVGEELMFKNRVEIIEDIVGISTTNKNVEVGIATLLLNSAVLTQKKQDEVGIYLLANVLPEITVSLGDPEAQFRALVAIGTLITCGPIGNRQQVKASISENSKFKEKLKALTQTGSSGIELKRKNCALQVENELLYS